MGTQFSSNRPLASGTSLKVRRSVSATPIKLITDSISQYTAVQTILSKIPPNNSKLTCASTPTMTSAWGRTDLNPTADVWEQYLFHYVSEGGFTYLVMAEDAAGR